MGKGVVSSLPRGLHHFWIVAFLALILFLINVSFMVVFCSTFFLGSFCCAFPSLDGLYLVIAGSGKCGIFRRSPASTFCIILRTLDCDWILDRGCSTGILFGPPCPPLKMGCGYGVTLLCCRSFCPGITLPLFEEFRCIVSCCIRFCLVRGDCPFAPLSVLELMLALSLPLWMCDH